MKQISGAFLLHIATAFTTQERSRSPVFHYILLQHPHTYLHPLVQHFRGSFKGTSTDEVLGFTQLHPLFLNSGFFAGTRLQPGQQAVSPCNEICVRLCPCNSQERLCLPSTSS
jgi:hypothetical protein